jgi:CRAL/TRIO domain
MQHAMRYTPARACSECADLRGFGFEHAGVAARDMIGRVMSVSMANYPEQMHTCYLVNVPWVFFALWRALTPMMSPRTVDKVSTSACIPVCWWLCSHCACNRAVTVRWSAGTHTLTLHEQRCLRARAMCACVYRGRTLQ